MAQLCYHNYQTKTGLAVRIRYLRSEDAIYLVDIFDHMGADSRYSRFRTSLNLTPQQIWDEARVIAGADPEVQVGFLAFADLPGRANVPVGAARYVLMEPGVAEAAVSVRDDMHGQGIGTQLMLLLSEEARANGVKNLVASVQNSNKAIIRLLNHLPYPYVRTSLGPDSEIKLDLSQSDIISRDLLLW